MWHLVFTSSLCPAGGFTKQSSKICLFSCYNWSKMLVCMSVSVISSSASPLCLSFWLCLVGFFFHQIFYLSCLVRLYPKTFTVQWLHLQWFWLESGKHFCFFFLMLTCQYSCCFLPCRILRFTLQIIILYCCCHVYANKKAKWMWFN